MALSEIISTGLNNPECAFYTGAFVGQWLAVKYLMIIWAIYVIFKFLDKLVIDLLAEKLKIKILKMFKCKKRGVEYERD